MAIYFSYEKCSGHINGWYTADGAPEVPDTHGVVASPFPPDFILGKEYAYLNGLVVELPPRPTGHHTWDGSTWQAPPIDLESANLEARAGRSRLLADSDWTQLPDVPLATRDAWAAYRQALRDITAQPGYPLDISWPVAPA